MAESGHAHSTIQNHESEVVVLTAGEDTFQAGSETAVAKESNLASCPEPAADREIAEEGDDTPDLSLANPNGTAHSKPPSAKQTNPIPARKEKVRSKAELEALIHSKDAQKITDIDASETGLADNDMLLLHNLPQLRGLMLWICPITDQGIVHLTTLRELCTLDLRATRITDRALEIIAEQLTNIRTLDLRNTDVTDAGVRRLCVLSELKLIDIRRTKATAESVKALKDAEKSRMQATDKEGWLIKRGHVKKSWRRRWFVMRNEVIRYYKHQEDASNKLSRPKGEIPLRGARVNSAKEMEREIGPNVFKITTTKKVYFIRADSVDDRREWKRCIRQKINYKPLLIYAFG